MVSVPVWQRIRKSQVQGNGCDHTTLLMKVPRKGAGSDGGYDLIPVGREKYRFENTAFRRTGRGERKEDQVRRTWQFPVGGQEVGGTAAASGVVAPGQSGASTSNKSMNDESPKRETVTRPDWIWAFHHPHGDHTHRHRE